MAERQALIRQIRATGLRPKAIDGRLLARSRTAIGGDELDEEQRKHVRTTFLKFLVELDESG